MNLNLWVYKKVKGWEEFTFISYYGGFEISKADNTIKWNINKLRKV
jgi:hypothetical protein